jgi:orotate phosphoribosyltransferase
MGIKAAYAEKSKDGRIFRRGFRLSGERVAVVDDVLTTGKSLTETIGAVEAAGGKVVAVGVVVRRGEFKGSYPFHYVVELDFPVYSPEECVLCKAGVPLIAPGKGGV